MDVLPNIQPLCQAANYKKTRSPKRKTPDITDCMRNNSEKVRRMFNIAIKTDLKKTKKINPHVNLRKKIKNTIVYNNTYKLEYEIYHHIPY